MITELNLNQQLQEFELEEVNHILSVLRSSLLLVASNIAPFLISPAEKATEPVFVSVLPLAASFTSSRL